MCKLSIFLPCYFSLCWSVSVGQDAYCIFPEFAQKDPFFYEALQMNLIVGEGLGGQTVWVIPHA